MAEAEAASETPDKGTNTDIVIAGYSTFPTQISTNDPFTLTIRLKKNKDTINDGFIIIQQNDSFALVNSGSKIAFGDTWDSKGEQSITINLRFTGGTTKNLNLSISYKSGNSTEQINDYVTINAVIPEKTPTPDPAKYKPNLSVANTSLPTAWAGYAFHLPLIIANTNPHAAKDVTITPSYEGSPNPFQVSTIKQSAFLSTIDGNSSAAVNFNYTIAPNTPPGVYPLKIKYNYSNLYQILYPTEDEIIYIKIDNGNNSPALRLDKVNYPKEGLKNGQSTEVKFMIKNNGGLSAKDIKITLQNLSAGGFAIKTGSNPFFITKIAGLEEHTLSLQMTVADKTLPGNYELTAKMEYSDEAGNTYIEEQQFFLPVARQDTQGVLRLSKIEYPQEGVKNGQPAAVTLMLKNNGKFSVKDIKVTLDKLSAGGFAIQNGSNPFFITKIDGTKEHALAIQLMVADTTKPGNYEIFAKIEYTDDAGNAYTEEQQFFLPVIRQDPQGLGIQLQNIEAPSGSISIDRDFAVRFMLINSGEAKVYNVKVTVGGDAVILPKTAAIKAFPVLSPGDTQSMSTTFTATSDAVTRNYPIQIQVEYDLDQGGERVKQTLIQYTGVFINNPEKKAGDGDGDSGPKTVPKIIIDSYTTSPNIVRAGENFNLNISFLNTNSARSVQNIKVFFTVNEATAESGSVFTPVNSSNTLFIDSIAPKRNFETDLTFYTIPDAKPKTYTITANFEYEDGDGNPYTATELIGIPVVQQSRLETSMINLPPMAFLEQPVSLFFEFYNMGRVTLNNLMISIEGDFRQQTGSIFIGNFEPGYNDYFDTVIFPTSTGTVTGYVVFAFDDSAGEHNEIRKEFTMNVEEMSEEMFNPEFPPDKYPPDYFEPPHQGGIMGLLKRPIVWIPGVLIVLGLVALIVIKKIKTRKELSLDE